MENKCVQANDDFVEPKPAKKPKHELPEDEQLICAVCLLEFKIKEDLIDHLIDYNLLGHMVEIGIKIVA